MRSGTSFFDFTIFNKNIQRYWPLWGAYLFIWLLILPINLMFLNRRLWSTQDMLEAAQTVHETLPLGLYMAFVFGLGAAMMVFGYLYNSRAACMTHALPLRRETLFWSSYLAGLAFLIGPHLLTALITLGIESLRGVAAPESLGVWLLGQSAMCLFFYSFAVFCGMFTGNALALPIFYGILNFLVWYLRETIVSYVAQFLYGMGYGAWGRGVLVQWCTPVLNLSGALQRDRGVTYMNRPEVLAIYAAAGAVLTVLALLVYRRRHMESAGDVVAVRVVRPVFQYGVAISTGLLGTILLYIFWGVSNPSNVSLVVGVILWSVAGYFAATMLLDKTFRVFHKWKGAAGLAVVILLFSLALEFDVLGFERRVPKVEEIQSVPFSSISGLNFDGGGNSLDLDEYSGLSTDSERLEKITALHHALANLPEDQRDRLGDNTISVNLDYSLRSGGSLIRRYHSVPVWKADRDVPGTVTYCVEQLLQDRELLRYNYGLNQQPDAGTMWAALENVVDAKTGSYASTGALDSVTSRRLWEAVQQDFDEGTIGIRYLFSEEASANQYEARIYFYWRDPSEDLPAHERAAAAADPYYKTHQINLLLTRQASHTLAVLEESGVLDAYRLEEN